MIDRLWRCARTKPRAGEALRMTLVLVTLVLGSCASHPSVEDAENPFVRVFERNAGGGPKDVYVFLDGTSNDGNSNTNVWRMYNLISELPNSTGLYLAGVGSAEDPLDTRRLGTAESLLELGLGKNMQTRVLAGYEFITRRYTPGDQIFIFGFSRGAHQARALAGLLAYAGVPELSKEDRHRSGSDEQYEARLMSGRQAPYDGDAQYLKRTLNDILELTKKQSDGEFLQRWRTWNPLLGPMLADEIAKTSINGRRGRRVVNVEVAFLGVWDTVPGSSLKRYAACKENVGMVKRYLGWLLPGIDKGERYKTDSYPAIRRIAHAVAKDEKRSKFAPILICDPIRTDSTSVAEVWFPGAHADVGGGYDGDGAGVLPTISLDWMLQLLTQVNGMQLEPNAADIKTQAKGLAHQSIDDSPANILSDCEDRIPPPKATVHESVGYRLAAGDVPLQVVEQGRKVVRALRYPINCADRVSH